jgi:hypothetical protein
MIRWKFHSPYKDILSLELPVIYIHILNAKTKLQVLTTLQRDDLSSAQELQKSLGSSAPCLSFSSHHNSNHTPKIYAKMPSAVSRDLLIRTIGRNSKYRTPQKDSAPIHRPRKPLCARDKTQMMRSKKGAPTRRATRHLQTAIVGQRRMMNTS